MGWSTPEDTRLWELFRSGEVQLNLDPEYVLAIHDRFFPHIQTTQRQTLRRFKDKVAIRRAELAQQFEEQQGEQLSLLA